MKIATTTATTTAVDRALEFISLVFLWFLLVIGATAIALFLWLVSSLLTGGVQ